jgi:hypothetical protein
MQTAKSIVEDKKNQISEIMKNVKGEMKKLGEIYKISSGGTPSRKEPSYWIDGNIPWLTTTEVTTTTTPTTKAVVTTAKPTTTKATTVATTKPVTTTVKSNTEETKNDNNERTNKLYYVDDNGYKSYFDECYQNYLYDLCVQYGITEYYTLLIAQIYHESTFRTNLISSTNDYGLMQINVCNHSWLRNKLGISDFLNPYENMQAGVYMMSSYLHKYGDAEKALVCYNLGEGGAKGVSSTSYSRGVLYDRSLLVELN